MEKDNKTTVAVERILLLNLTVWPRQTMCQKWSSLHMP